MLNELLKPHKNHAARMPAARTGKPRRRHRFGQVMEIPVPAGDAGHVADVGFLELRKRHDVAIARGLRFFLCKIQRYDAHETPDWYDETAGEPLLQREFGHFADKDARVALVQREFYAPDDAAYFCHSNRNSRRMKRGLSRIKAQSPFASALTIRSSSFTPRSVPWV